MCTGEARAEDVVGAGTGIIAVRKRGRGKSRHLGSLGAWGYWDLVHMSAGGAGMEAEEGVAVGGGEGRRKFLTRSSSSVR